MTTAMQPEKTYSRTAEYRKICKPIVERKRRARMNKSLIELKSIILDVVKKDGCQYSKLEKADILEMTVKHLHQLRTSDSRLKKDENLKVEKFRAGFVQCAAEVSRFMYQVDNSKQNNPIRARLLNHLNSCVGQLDQFHQQPPPHRPDTLSPSGKPQMLPVYTPPTSPTSPASTTSSIFDLSPVPSTVIHRSCDESSMPLALTVSSQSNSSPWRPWH